MILQGDLFCVSKTCLANIMPQYFEYSRPNDALVLKFGSFTFQWWPLCNTAYISTSFSWTQPSQYMVILFLLFLIQFSLAIALLAMTKNNQEDLIKAGWDQVSTETKNDAMKSFECCDLMSWKPSDDLTCPVSLSFAKYIKLTALRNKELLILCWA